MLSWILEPLQFAFMQRSLAIAVAVGIICAAVGCYLMVQRLALLGDALSHSLLPGLAIAYIIRIHLYVGAFIAALVSTYLISLIHRRSPVKEDAAMGVVLSGFFAAGITLITVIQKDNKIDLAHFLFGNLLAVTADEVRDTALIALVVVVSIILLYKELLFFSFDPQGAEAAGLPTQRLHLGLMMLVALTVVASMKAVGVILVLAMLITPAVTAYLLVPRFHHVMLASVVCGVCSSIAGLYLSYYFNLPSGPAIVLVLSGIFAIAFAWHQWQKTRAPSATIF
jgi:manganese/iron transport system permease protein